MDTESAVRSATRVLGGAPSSVLPVFLAASGTALVPQVFVLLGVGLAYLSLRGTGRIERLVDAVGEFSAGMQGSGGPASDPGIDEAAADALFEALSGLVTGEVIGILGVAAAVAVVVGLFARGVAAAARVHTTVGALGARPPVEAGVAGAGRDWRSYVGYVVLRALVGLAAVGLPVALIGLGGVAGTGVAVLMFVLGLGLAAVIGLGGFVLLLFVPQAIAIDGVGLAGAIRRNGRFLLDNPVRALAYVAVAVGLWLVVGFGSALLSVLGLNAVGSVAILLTVTPWLALFKTALYVEGAPPTFDSEPAWARFRATFRQGLDDLWWFVRGHPGSQIGCAAVFGAATAGSYLAVVPYSLGLEGPESASDVFGTFPVTEFLSIAANNWLVAISQAFAGMALGVPALSNLAFNGLIVGTVLGIGFDLTTGLALVVPHAVVEIPALIVSGALGIRLGRFGWRYVRGDADAETVAGELRRAFSVLVGLAPVFLVAAAIEAFVTPWVAMLVV